MPVNKNDLPETQLLAMVFATTHWSVVLATNDSTIPAAREALEKLCHGYWYPLYAYVRRRGHDSHIEIEKARSGLSPPGSERLGAEPLDSSPV